MSKSASPSEVTQEHKDGSDKDSDHEHEENEGSTNPGRQFNKFELLGLVDGADLSESDEDNQDSQEERDDDNQENKAAKKPAIAPQHGGQATSSTKRKARKKRGKRGAKSKNPDLEDIEDEVNNLAKAIVLHSSANHKRDDNLRFRMLKVDMRNLIPELEIKRMFGKGVIKDDKHGRVKQHAGSNLQRSRFVSAGYFEAKSSGGPSGPRMDLDETMNKARRDNLRHTTGYSPSKHNTVDAAESSSAIFNSDEPIYFKFVHDRAYQDAQRAFLHAVNRGDPESIVQNLSIAPLHAESLVQLSHMVRVSEDYKSASEFIERALIVFERGFHPRFNLATANCRLTYKRPENRTFFITIFKHITYCHRRGLRRTPFEYSKLLLSLEPENDPLQALQMLDFFALRSEDYDYVIDFYQKWDRSQKLPNISYSIALAHFLKSRSSKQTREENSKNLTWADEFLQRALLIFPNFIIPLLNACSGEPSDELRKCTYFDYSVYGTNYKLVPETVDVLVNLYVKRNYSLWKQKPVMAWLEKNVEIMVNKFKSGDLTDERRQIEHWHAFPKVVPKNLLRHIVLCDLDMKIPQSASSSTFLDIDPYPPTDCIVSYDANLDTSIQPAQGEAGSLIGNLGGLFLRSFLPSFSLTDQQQQQQQQQQQPQGPTETGEASGRPAPSHQANGRRQQSGGQARNSNEPGLQITMADYVIDDEEDVAANQATAPGGNYNELHSTISDLGAAIAGLVNLQPTIRAHMRRQQDGGNAPNQTGGPNQQGGSGTDDDNGNRRNP